MSRCSAYLELGASELGGELTAEQRIGLAEHLSVCRTCAGALRSYAAVLTDARRAGVPEPGASYWDDFGPALRRRMAREAGAESRGRLSWLLGRPAPALASAVFVALVLVLVGRHAGPGPAEADPPAAALEELLAVTASLDLAYPEDAPALSLQRTEDQQAPNWALLGRSSEDPFAFFELSEGLEGADLSRLYEVLSMEQG